MEDFLLQQYNSQLADTAAQAQGAYLNNDAGIAQVNNQISPLSFNTMQGQNIGIQPLLPPGVNPVDINEQQNNTKFGLKDIFDLYRRFSPVGAAFRGAKALHTGLQNSDFGRSSSLADYLNARQFGGIDARQRAAEQNMREARAIQKQIDMRPSNIQTNQERGRNPTNNPGPSEAAQRATSYRDSSSFGSTFHGK